MTLTLALLIPTPLALDSIAGDDGAGGTEGMDLDDQGGDE